MGSGAFGMSSVSAFSVTARIGGGTGTLSWAGTQRRQGGRHALVVVHPDESIKVEKCRLVSAYCASLETFSEDVRTEL